MYEIVATTAAADVARVLDAADFATAQAVILRQWPTGARDRLMLCWSASQAWPFSLR
jgi:hypothetical protein